MPESYVGVAADGAGKKIRNLQITTLQADGSLLTVQMQVVAIGDEEGNPVRFSETFELQQQMLDEIRATRMGIQLLVDWLNPVASVMMSTPVSKGIRVLPTNTSNVEENELIEMARDFRADEDV